jgi:hypothetical protein
MLSRLLPSPEEQDWITDALGEIARLAGFEPLVCAPLLLPEPRFFPDRWSPDVDGVRRLARRLQGYAGLEELKVEIELFDHDRELAPGGVMPHSIHHEGAAAYFAGIVDDVCLFGVDVEQLDDALGVTAAMAHEVAHAFRARFELAITDPERVDEEERLTDLTTVYFGAGVLTTNAAARHRSGGLGDGLLQGHQWSFRTLGYLSPASMAYALAIVAVVRGLDRSGRRELVDKLELNQAASFKRAVAQLEPERDKLRERLGVPIDAAAWPKPWPLDQLTAPFLEDDAPVAVPLAPVDPRWNLGRKVFRVLPGYELRDRILAGVVAAVVAGVALQIHAALALVALVLGVPGFRMLIRKYGPHHCSERDCVAILPQNASSCPQCGGTIAGSIRGSQQRLAAAEELGSDDDR